MSLGIFSKVYAEHDFESAIKKLKGDGFSNIQFNFSNIGLSSLPDVITQEQMDYVKTILKKYDISLSAVSGTFNTLERDKTTLNNNIKKFDELVKASSEMGSPIVSICTGSFNQNNMWADHPNNGTQEAWTKLKESLTPMLDSAHKYNVDLAFEPEQANVVKNAEMSIELINSFDSAHLKVLFDAANLIHPGNANNMKETIDDALVLLKNHIVLAHCKDIWATSESIEFKPVGRGNLPLGHYLNALKSFYDGPIVMHGVEESEVEYAINYLNKLSS